MFDQPLNCLAAPGAASLPVQSWRPAEWRDRMANGSGGPSSPDAHAFLAAAGFTAAAGQLMALPGPGGTVAGLALGLGEDRSLWTHAAVPTAALARLPDGLAWHLVPGDFDMHDAVLGWCLGAYRFDRLKSAPGPTCALLAGTDTTDNSEVAPALAMARAVWLVRDLINTPANLLGPKDLAEATLALAARFGAVGTTIDDEALAQAYPAIAAVGAGSDRSPVVAGFTWSGSGAAADAPLLSLCGKGVVFDTGGYDLKPSSAMLRMKKDMGGAALLLGLASAVMAADWPIRLAVRIGCVENSVSGRAMRPSDVIQTRKGLTVEIGNTDAEGRLVLCDLLDEAATDRPALLIDAATLTGAARVALGPDLPAILCNDDEVAATMERAGQRSNDSVWRLPLHGGYDAWLKSEVADLNNTAGKPMAGAIVAGLFLQRFIPPGTPWLHLDTYAWNDSTRPGRPEGGEALGLRALFATVAALKRFNIQDLPGKTKASVT